MLLVQSTEFSLKKDHSLEKTCSSRGIGKKSDIRTV